ncbi:MAG: amidase [Acidobacteriota bacterium]|nr:amidase [Acidobacteriota bacterium]
MTTQELEPQEINGVSRRQVIHALSLAGAAGLLAGCNGDATTAADSAADVAAGPMPDDLWRAGARELAAAIRRGEVSSVEVIESHLARVEAVNGHLNAVVRVLADEARAAAQAADEAVAAGAELGPLHGVPISVKDNIAVAGTPTTNGVPANENLIAERDDLIVARLRNAGAIVLTRTNLPDLGLRVHTDSFLYGLTRNPWAADRNVGGSSGGEGSALASGMSCLGLGNDIGGSLRIPAQCNGIASLKPTLGRIASPFVGELSSQLMAVNGPMARRVSDLRTAYELIGRYHRSDPWSMPVPLDLDRPSEPIKVALVPEPSGGSTHPDVAAGVRSAGEALAAVGYAVEEIEPPLAAEARRAWEVFLGYELHLARQVLEQIMSPDAYEFLMRGLEVFDAESPTEYVGMFAQRHRVATAWQEFQEDYPITLAPIMTQPPFVIGYDLQEPGDVLDQMRFEVALNLLGLPAVCVPTGVANGLPQVVEVIGGRYREGLCLEAAQALEDALGIITPIDPVMA